MLNSITILGSSSGRNGGDAALLSGIMDSIDHACQRRVLYEIPTYRPHFIWNNYDNRVRPVSMLPWAATVGMFGAPTLRSVLRSDMSIIYDAMLFDRKLYNPLTNYMPSVWLLLKAAKRAGKKLGMFNVGLGPVTTERGKRMLTELAESMDFITVRDEDSLALLQELGVRNDNVLLTADAALNVRPAPAERIDQIFSQLGLPSQGDREILGINVNAYLNTWAGLEQKPLTSAEFVEIYSNALERILERVKVPLLFVATQHHDVAITRAVMDAVRTPVKKALLSNVDYSHYEIRGCLERIGLLFAMRLHANILCSAGLTPIAALSFQKKVSSYYSLLGLNASLLSFSDFTSERIAEHVLSAWDRRADTRAVLERQIPRLQRDALKAAEIVALVNAGMNPSEALNAVRQRTSIEAAQAASAA